MTPHDWISVALTVAMFLIGISMVPVLRNIVNIRFEEIEEHFCEMEEKAHAAILQAIDGLKQDFHSHNADAHAHANLASFAKLETKLEEVRTEIVNLRVDLATARRQNGGRNAVKSQK